MSVARMPLQGAWASGKSHHLKSIVMLQKVAGYSEPDSGGSTGDHHLLPIHTVSLRHELRLKDLLSPYAFFEASAHPIEHRL